VRASWNENDDGNDGGGDKNDAGFGIDDDVYVYSVRQTRRDLIATQRLFVNELVLGAYKTMK
jgi:hypothetical protein